MSKLIIFFVLITLIACTRSLTFSESFQTHEQKVFNEIDATVYNQSKLTDVVWKLVELNGVHIALDSMRQKVPYIQFLSDEQRVVGNDGCNNFFGSYEIRQERNLVLSSLASTRMACFDVTYDYEYMNALSQELRYSVVQDSLFFYTDSLIVIKCIAQIQ